MTPVCPVFGSNTPPDKMNRKEKKREKPEKEQEEERGDKEEEEEEVCMKEKKKEVLHYRSIENRALVGSSGGDTQRRRYERWQAHRVFV